MMKKTVLSFLMLAICVMAYGQAIKIMSFNIRYENQQDPIPWDVRKGAVRHMIMDEHPTLIGLQEVLSGQEKYLVEMLHGYNCVGVGRDDGKRKGEIMDIFYDTSVVELRSWGTFWLSKTPDKPSKGWDAACMRTCTWALLTLKENGKKILFLNTHLDHVGKKARKNEVRLIADSIKAMSNRLGVEFVYLTGDFNTSTSNKIFKPLKAVMREARAESYKTDWGYTYNGYGKVKPEEEKHELDANGNTDNDVVIDHIFFMGGDAARFWVNRDGCGLEFISDHFPVMGIFKLP